MLGIFILCKVMHSAVMLGVFILCTVIHNVVMLSVVMLSGVMLRPLQILHLYSGWFIEHLSVT